jgi:hypothetical protein
VSTPRILVSLAAAAALAGCGSGFDQNATTTDSTTAQRALAVDPAPLLPTPAPLPGPAAVCIGPACHEDRVTLGPVAPPSTPSLPLGPTSPIPVPAPVPSICLFPNIAMQVLVISATASEPTLPAIQEALGYHTIPFTTWIATQNLGMLTPDKLATGCDGKYQAVILATGNLAYSPDGGLTYVSGLTPAEWLALRSYESSFKVRELSWYAYPGADHGLTSPGSGVDTGTTPINATLTGAGQKIFSSVNASNPIPITYAWTYLATPTDASVTPLLVDSAGHALASSRVTADGRETMTLTFDSNPWLIHDLVLAHGLVEWVTKGIHLGEFRAYTEAQIDDLLIPNDMYLGGSFRMTDADFNATRAWQAARKTVAGPDFRLAWAFNGFGSTDATTPEIDPLSVAARTFSGEFQWISHTWDHENLDALAYDWAFWEFAENDKFAKGQGYRNYSTLNLVTPQISGLKNSAAINAAWDAGVRYLVSDTSQPGWNNPAPNIGIHSAIQPGMLIIPRKPTNLYVNVSTPAEWMAEYNAVYTSYWGRALTYEEILDKESHNLLIYLLQGNIDPVMYHQPNTRAYDGKRTLLGDLLDVTFAKFRRHSTLPIMSPDQNIAGVRIANTMARNKAGVVATLTPGVSVSFSSPVAVEFAFTGVCTSTSEKYAGACITNVKVGAGQTVTFFLL